MTGILTSRAVSLTHLVVEQSNALVDQWLISQLSVVPNLATRLKFSLKPGHRHRMVLALLCSQLGGSDAPPECEKLALALELGHKASLICDDLIDDDTRRGGKPSFPTQFGVGDSVVIANMLLAEALKIVQALGLGYEITEAFWTMSLAQAADLIESKRLTYSLSLKVNEGKAGALGAVAANLAGRLSGCSTAQCNSLSELGASVAKLSQLANDFDDICGTDEDRPVGTEFRAGRRSPVAVLCLQYLAPDAATSLTEPLAEDTPISSLRAALRNRAVYLQISETADELFQQAKSSLVTFDESPAKRALELGATLARARIEKYFA